MFFYDRKNASPCSSSDTGMPYPRARGMTQRLGKRLEAPSCGARRCERGCHSCTGAQLCWRCCCRGLSSTADTCCGRDGAIGWVSPLGDGQGQGQGAGETDAEAQAEGRKRGARVGLPAVVCQPHAIALRRPFDVLIALRRNSHSRLLRTSPLSLLYLLRMSSLSLIYHHHLDYLCRYLCFLHYNHQCMHRRAPAAAAAAKLWQHAAAAS